MSCSSRGPTEQGAGAAHCRVCTGLSSGQGSGLALSSLDKGTLIWRWLWGFLWLLPSCLYSQTGCKGVCLYLCFFMIESWWLTWASNSNPTLPETHFPQLHHCWPERPTQDPTFLDPLRRATHTAFLCPKWHSIFTHTCICPATWEMGFDFLFWNI